MVTPLSGVGIGLRQAFHAELLSTNRQVDWLEIVAENFMDASGRRAHILAQCAERWPIVAHGVALSLGGPDPMGAHLDALRPLLSQLDPPFFTDHLCYASIGGLQTFDLLPLPFHVDAVMHVAGRARAAQQRLERPMLLENITYYAEMPGGELDEPDFLRAVIAESTCGFLLDVNNLYVNAVNRGHDPRAILSRMPLESVGQIHLAGFAREGDLLLDTHSGPVAEEVWELYREALESTGPVPTLIEWDQAIPSLEAVLDEADRARTILGQASKKAA